MTIFFVCQQKFTRVDTVEVINYACKKLILLKLLKTATTTFMQTIIYAFSASIIIHVMVSQNL